jgi:hypothetical protein
METLLDTKITDGSLIEPFLKPAELAQILRVKETTIND